MFIFEPVRIGEKKKKTPAPNSCLLKIPKVICFIISLWESLKDQKRMLIMNAFNLTRTEAYV